MKQVILSGPTRQHQLRETLAKDLGATNETLR
jgi:hypothetical protein